MKSMVLKPDVFTRSQEVEQLSRFVSILMLVLMLVLCPACDEGQLPPGTFIDHTAIDWSYRPDPGSDAFQGKNWLVIGDSISVRSVVASNYEQFVSEWLGCEVINVAVAGTGYVAAPQGSSNWVELLDDLPPVEEVDFITVMGALNDWYIPLGNPLDTGSSTFYGALDQFYGGLTERYPGIPVGVITSTPRYFRYGDRRQYLFSAYDETSPYVHHIDAVINVALKYRLAVLDLYRTSTLEPQDPAKNKDCFIGTASYPDGDGVHPNTKGHFSMAQQIFAFIVASLGTN